MLRRIAGRCRLGLPGVLLGAMAPVWAQAPAPASAPAASTVAAPAEEAMERARRQAANPMRVILEASRGAPPVAKPTALVRATEEATAAAQPRLAVAPVPAVARTPRQLKLNSSLVDEPADPPEPPLQPLAAETVVPTWGTAAPSAVPEPALLPPRLLSMVEPELPSSLLQGSRRITELPVDLRLRPDGSVAEVVVAAPAPQALVRAVVQALEQWRYEPQGRERLHRVQLVFNADR